MVNLIEVRDLLLSIGTNSSNYPTIPKAKASLNLPQSLRDQKNHQELAFHVHSFAKQTALDKWIFFDEVQPLLPQQLQEYLYYS